MAMFLAATAQPASAQSAGGGYYYETFRYGYNPGYYARRHPVPAPDYRGLYFSSSAVSTKTMPSRVTPGTYLHYAPAASGNPQGGGNPGGVASRRSARVEAPAPTEKAVQIELRVPANAAVWIGGARTEQTGALRQFVSPPLAPGQYVYEVRVTWKNSVREVAESRQLRVSPGDSFSLSFPAAAVK
jgi:uncharacterized protein (TIGR03000 family)